MKKAILQPLEQSGPENLVREALQQNPMFDDVAIPGNAAGGGLEAMAICEGVYSGHYYPRPRQLPPEPNRFVAQVRRD